MIVHEPYPADHFETHSRQCDICERSPARPLAYRGVTGLVLIQRYWSYRGAMCRSCSRGLFRQFQLKLFTRGWWSLPGLVVTPMLLIANAVTAHLHQFELDMPQPPDPETEGELEGRPLYLRPAPMLVSVTMLTIVLSAL